MESVRLMLDINYGDYSCIGNSNVRMLILGCFFASDVGCRTTFRDWAETATDGDCCSGNITGLEIEGDDILLTDLYPEVPDALLKMTKNQFIKLCDEWFEKVCKNTRDLKPKELEIIHDNDKFWIEIKE